MPLLVVAAWLAGINWFIWACVLLVAYGISLVMALPSELINRQLFQALLKLPRAVGAMLTTVLHMKKANKTFIHTVHTKTEINNPLFHEHSK